jgi:hypothetical protein
MTSIKFSFAPHFINGAAVCCLVILLLAALPCHAQAVPAARHHNPFVSVGLEVKQTAVDFVTWRHPAWNLMVLAQLGADLADAKTTVDAERRDPRGIEIHSLLYGQHPDFKTVALTDFGTSMLLGTASHWLHTHRPEPYIKTADYWWIAPQAIDIIGTGRAAYINAGIKLPKPAQPSPAAIWAHDGLIR